MEPAALGPLSTQLRFMLWGHWAHPGAQSVTVAPFHTEKSAPCSALVHRRQASRLQGSLEAFANDSITRSTNCRAEHDLLSRRADVHTPRVEQSLAARPLEEATAFIV